MNIFVLSTNHDEAAKWHVDKHVSKMPLESAQLLCTNLNNINVPSPYKSCHMKHPCTLWVGMSRSNFEWLCGLGLSLCEEYQHRYGRVHACKAVIEYCQFQAKNFVDNGLTPFAQAMPDEYKRPDAVDAYRAYYNGGKRHLATWSKRSRPDWWVSNEEIADIKEGPHV